MNEPRPYRTLFVKSLQRAVFVLGMLIAAGGAAAVEDAPSAPRSADGSQAQDLTREAVYREAYQERVAGTVFKTSVDAHWSDDGTWFWYRNDLPEGRKEFVLVEPAQRRRVAAFDHTCIGRGLERLLDRGFDAERLPFDHIDLDRSRASVDVRVDGGQYRCNLTSCICGESGPGDASPGVRARGAPSSPPNASPDGRFLVETRNDDLVVVDTATKTPARLTTNGSPDGSYQALGWSPDGSTIVAARIAPGQNRQYPLIDYGARQGAVSRVQYVERPFAGDRFPSYEIRLFRAGPQGGWPGRSVSPDLAPMDFLPPWILGWSKHGGSLIMAWMHRGGQRLQVAKVDVNTGDVRTLVDETAATFVDRYNLLLQWLPETEQVLYASEQDGWRHLYLYSGDGTSRGRVTGGTWAVRDVVRIDEERRRIWFGAGGREEGRDPYLVHYYSVGFDGTELTLLTPGDGHHEIRFSPSGDYFLDTWSRVDLAPRTELRRSDDGTLVVNLETADVSALLATGWRWPEPFHAKGRDGLTDIWGIVFRPSNLEAGESYPVIEQIYPGPQRTNVPKAFEVASFDQALAENGFIVVKIDAMGTPYRSKAFHDVAWKNLGDCGFADRIAWVRELAAEYPYVDADRLGVFGHSAGGYCATRALLVHPEAYNVGWASAGNHDLSTDSAYFVEQFMGLPVGEHYTEQSNLHLAANLRGRLCLTVGGLDRRVPPGNTYKMVQALIDADKSFDLLVFPTGEHSPGGEYAIRRIFEYFREHLLDLGS